MDAGGGVRDLGGAPPPFTCREAWTKPLPPRLLSWSLGECAQGCRRAARVPALPELKFMAPELAQGDLISSHASNTTVKQPHASWIKHFKIV